MILGRSLFLSLLHLSSADLFYYTEIWFGDFLSHFTEELWVHKCGKPLLSLATKRLAKQWEKWDMHWSPVAANNSPGASGCLRHSKEPSCQMRPLRPLFTGWLSHLTFQSNDTGQFERDIIETILMQQGLSYLHSNEGIKTHCIVYLYKYICVTFAW